jgi:D-3-phosphoglycerate dehydrogenase / 2-oxoglutarate reductase
MAKPPLVKPPMPKVLVCDGIHSVAQEVLAASCEVIFEPAATLEAITALLPSMDGLMVRSGVKVTPEMMAEAPHLKIIGRAGVGTDNIDLKAATRLGMIVVNSPGGNTTAAAEHTIGMIMALARNIPQADHVLKGGGWRTKALTGVELDGKILGVIGFGKIGRKVASVFQRMGMHVLVYDPFLSQQSADELKVRTVSLETLYAESDVITLHAPKTPETEQMLNTQAFAQMKDGVRLVNCARGGIIDEAALIAAVQSGKVAGVALDVFQKEPLPPESPLLQLGEKLIATPHLGASTFEAQVSVAQDVAEQFVTFFETGMAEHAVNIPALKKELIDPVRAYLPMAEGLGAMLAQVAPGGITQVDVAAAGALSQANLMPLTLSILKGLLGQAREGVNYVNALALAEEEGIVVKESKLPRPANYNNLLQIDLATDTGRYNIAGTLLSDTHYRVVTLNDYQTHVAPSGCMLLAPHRDQPGMIAKIATLLGEHQINVSALQVARRSEEAGGESMMIFNLDTPPSAQMIEAMKSVDGIYSVKVLEYTHV